MKHKFSAALFPARVSYVRALPYRSSLCSYAHEQVYDYQMCGACEMYLNDGFLLCAHDIHDEFPQK
jgi:hypothetical protein